MAVEDKLQKIIRESAVANFKVLARNLLEGT
jgi:hypothetical protein